MRTLLLSLLIFLVPGIGISQHYHFVYIQGDNQQTFYIKKTGETLSSSASGFIILPKLQSGTHQFTIGFPKNQWPEYEFQVEVRSADRGFTLKNFGDRGWGLFDLQTLDIIYGKRIDPPKAELLPDNPKSDDPFSVILASAVGDPGIRETALVAMKFDKQEAVAVKVAPVSPPVVKNETPKPSSAPVTVGKDISSAPPGGKAETQKPATVTQPVMVTKDPPVTTETAKATGDQQKTIVEPPKPVDVVVAPPVMKPEQVKKEDVKAAPKFESEPVLPSIPRENKVGDSASGQVSRNNYGMTRQVRKISEIRSWKTTELIFLDVTAAGTDTVTVIIEHDAVEPKPQETTAAVPAPLANRQDCVSMATEKDMLNLRKRVLRLKTEEDMLEATIKDIKAKCYNVEMLQNTSYVFVSDRMRYSLFEGAYPHIYDPANYSRLERLLTSEEYINKFRELIKSK